jgi:HAD superfamily hydrolase (TIGR01509 family)
MVEAIIFDMDGLMIDSERVTFEGYKHVCQSLGLEMNRDIYVTLLGKNKDDTLDLLRSYYGENIDGSILREGALNYLTKYFENEGVPIKKGLLELLEFCRQEGIRAVLATSSTRERVDKILLQAGITDYFYDSVCGDEVENGKPDPDIFLKAAEKSGVPYENCLILEDSQAGIEAGYRSGIDLVCVPDMKYPEPEFAAKTKKIAGSLLDVIDFVKEENH